MKKRLGCPKTSMLIRNLWAACPRNRPSYFVKVLPSEDYAPNILWSHIIYKYLPLNEPVFIAYSQLTYIQVILTFYISYNDNRFRCRQVLWMILKMWL